MLRNLVITNTHVEVKLNRSKTDIYRKGSSVLIAKTGNKLCPVTWLSRYIDWAAKLTPGSEEFLFTSVQFCRKLGTYKASNQCSPLSYTRAREILLGALTAVGLDKSKYFLHNLRSGGVTAAVNNKVSDRLLRVHGRWASDISKDGYIEDSLYNRLFVSRNLSIWFVWFFPQINVVFPFELTCLLLSLYVSNRSERLNPIT